MYGYGLFTGGLGLHGGLEGIGATVIPISGGNSERQIMVMKDFGVTAICGTPSYFIHLIETAQKMGIDFKRDLKVKRGVFGAEPWTDEMRQYIESASGVKAFDIYGLSEIIGPGVGAECECQNGLHIFEDHFLVEIVDTETLEPVADGEYGEVVFTTLTKEGIPIVRYRTRDISRIIAEPCTCGRTFRRMERITGRSDDMLIIRGVNVFPNQIEQVLAGIPGVARHYEVVLSKRGALDDVSVRVEVAPDFAFDEVRELERLQRRVKSEIESALAVSIAVKLVEPKSIVRSEGKAKRVVDLRGEQGGA